MRKDIVSVLGLILWTFGLYKWSKEKDDIANGFLETLSLFG